MIKKGKGTVQKFGIMLLLFKKIITKAQTQVIYALRLQWEVNTVV